MKFESIYMPRFESGTRGYDVGLLANVPQRTVKSAEKGKGGEKGEK
jgi:hypothetical protein